ncbi:Bug family tripartite tricarboxylate transporter substrate binding protein [Falsiroseomonas stagni]|uniref:Tripartite-type tricarboxylate transporter, receptor component TctC n=1 Tax=Falsiroseomonas stagni DSM 19981 TaxID=1123062 RepID=A0A1I3ZQN5_9PROT|nr:tripartite tricarboxylate transporter substrate binding protein [Falsiroseomonas stagni]SFK46474.1 Tripartite-type tricarboxylate transporter, receptor component TctC [Falsiroseomonas stagni DSM 19981]
MLRRTLLATVPALLAAPALAQPGFPSRPIRFIVGFPPGGTTDLAARLMAPKMQAVLGQPVVVENRTGAHGNIASDFVVRSAPDGHTILMGTIGGLAINQTLYGNLTFDPQLDLQPITRVGMIVNVLAVPADRPWRSVEEYVAAGKRDPLTFGSSGAGGAGHLAGEQLNLLAGLRNIHVPYRGGAPLITDLMTGKIDSAFTPSSGAGPQAEAGRLKMLAVTSKARSPLLPTLPAIAETPGLADFDMVDWSAMVGPRNLPAPIVQALHHAATTALLDPEVLAAFALRQIEATPSTPEECAAFIRAETTKWTPIVRASGARPD